MGKADVDLLYVLPSKINSETQILFVIHGASRNAERKAAEITKRKDKNILDLTACNNFVKITINKFFMKKIAETMNTNKSITSKVLSISCST